MSRQTWNEAIASATIDGIAVANTTTESVIFPGITIPASYLQDGRTIRLKAYGKLSTTGTPTIQFAIRLGGVPAGTLLAQTELITNGSAVANVNWSIEAILQVRTNGSSGTVIVMGDAIVHTSATAVAHNVFGVSGHDAPAAVAVDLMVDQLLVLTADWSAASVSNTLTGLVFIIESLN